MEAVSASLPAACDRGSSVERDPGTMMAARSSPDEVDTMTLSPLQGREIAHALEISGKSRSDKVESNPASAAGPGGHVRPALPGPGASSNAAILHRVATTRPRSQTPLLAEELAPGALELPPASAAVCRGAVELESAHEMATGRPSGAALASGSTAPRLRISAGRKSILRGSLSHTPPDGSKVTTSTRGCEPAAAAAATAASELEAANMALADPATARHPGFWGQKARASTGPPRPARSCCKIAPVVPRPRAAFSSPLAPNTVTSSP